MHLLPTWSAFSDTFVNAHDTGVTAMSWSVVLIEITGAFAMGAVAQTARVGFPDDDGLTTVLREFAVAPDALLGHGGEAWVYALDDTDTCCASSTQVGGSTTCTVANSSSPSWPSPGQRSRSPEVLEIGECAGILPWSGDCADGRCSTSCSTAPVPPGHA